MRHIERFEDMSPRGKLILTQQEDGDIVVGIIPTSLEKARRHFVQTAGFCTVGSGGGQSPRTLAALVALMDAIEADNREAPQFRR